jgi:hypothetical protein
VRSTVELRSWLEALREAEIKNGADIPRPVAPDDKPSEKSMSGAQQVEALRARLLVGVPPNPAERSPDQQARFILRICSTGIVVRTRRSGGSTSVCWSCPRPTSSTNRGPWRV